MTSLCRSVWSGATAALTCFHWDQKHFHIFLASFWEDLWPFTVLSQPHHLRCVQNKVVPTQFLLHLLDTQLPSDSASVSIMRSSACLSELLTLPRTGRLSPPPALAHVPQATAAPELVFLLLVLQVALLIMLDTSLVLTNNSSGDVRLENCKCRLRGWKSVGR